MQASMTSLPAAVDDRPPLPLRPAPHERDGREDQQSAPARPHPQESCTAAATDPTIGEALRRVVEAQIGPRRVGAIYQNATSAFEVVAVVRDPERARELLNRRCAQWAVIVKDVFRADAEPFPVGSVWASTDHLVREGRPARTSRDVVTGRCPR
ncbi:hypothetical protein [Streptomyces spectabilis]|uniref:Uncharacterized protein n=1 Tax=Streptomyces spectabilis TaxID=68270 RepID=A0A7W8B3U0_STRST|nr:hypothetical protein [Streptomyces spectabilis]MBB5109191.1 hypothetical protein [Streptomyces spectabilis]MCI3907748.1 hypothetical protein [Streptomyces spectabilis]GGV51288.1 hypothetical protein GCM10010245_80820 [Streptomyces spectabilis]